MMEEEEEENKSNLRHGDHKQKEDQSLTRAKSSKITMWV